MTFPCRRVFDASVSTYRNRLSCNILVMVLQIQVLPRFALITWNIGLRKCRLVTGLTFIAVNCLVQVDSNVFVQRLFGFRKGSRIGLYRWILHGRLRLNRRQWLAFVFLRQMRTATRFDRILGAVLSFIEKRPRVLDIRILIRMDIVCLVTIH